MVVVMKYWKYKAYNTEGRPVEGVTHTDSNEFAEAVLALGQRGLDVYDIWGITYNQYIKAAKLGRRLGKAAKLQDTVQKARAMRVQRRRERRIKPPGIRTYLTWGPLYLAAWMWWKATTRPHLLVIVFLSVLVVFLLSRLVSVSISF